nr:Mov34/MPN/PAD-1 family protein [Myxococcus sp. CA040A]
MLGFQQVADHDAEAGGVLLGRILVNCDDVVIDEVTLPMTEDTRGRFTFHRARSRHQQVVDDRWKDSRGTCLYLGEWHTHPEPYPTPSHVDVGDWRRRLREDQFEGESLLFLIVGTHSVGAWEGRRRSRRILPLQPMGDPLGWRR